jgi:hypothetical protein
MVNDDTQIGSHLWVHDPVFCSLIATHFSSNSMNQFIDSLSVIVRLNFQDDFVDLVKQFFHWPASLLLSEELLDNLSMNFEITQLLHCRTVSAINQ